MKMIKDIYLGAGCFWGAEKFLSNIKGVVDTCVGYANGSTENPSYEEVCSGRTGHVEAVKVSYDTDVVDLEVLLDLFYTVIDPTSVNRQGNDVGTQYRTGIYFADPGDETVASKSLSILQKRYDNNIVVECESLKNFYPAEEYHQKYLEKNPEGYCHIGDGVCKAAARLSSSTGSSLQGEGKQLFRRKSDDQLRRELTDMQYNVTQNEGTEPPFQNEFNDHFERGIYVDITSGAPLFVSTDKFESGCGWPSFSRPIDELTVNELPDDRHGMRRTEVRSKIGDAHLGHVFNDGPRDQGGLRYCINSAALRFIPESEMEKEGYGEYLPQLDR